MYCTGVRDGKKEKEGKINLSSVVFCPIIYLATLKKYIKLRDSVSVGAEKSVTENLIGKKEKWTNKGNDKQQEADSLLHNTSSHTQYLYQISKS